MKLLDSLLYIAVLLFGQLYVLHGKAFSEYMFSEKTIPFRDGAYGFWTYFIVLATSVAFQLLRNQKIQNRTAILASSAVASVSVVITTFLSNDPSTLIFFLHAFIYLSALVIIFFERFIVAEMDREFWKIVLDAVLKTARYTIAVFVAGFAVLKFLVEGIGESKVGFLTTLFYPSIVLAFSFFFWGYWIFLPAWIKMVESYKIENSQPSVPYNSGQSLRD